ncbi:putative reverse transcriptase domain-containing protein [Tanacetum coccineum]
MAPTTRRGPNTPVNNTNPNNMTPESIQAMIDQALLRNSTNGDGSHSSYEDNRRNVQTAQPFVKGNDVPAYTERFQELTLICTKFVANEIEKVGKYISGLPDNIYENVKSARPKMLDETIELANELMDQKLRTYAERQSDNKRKVDDSSRNNHGHQQQPFKRQNVAKVYNMGTGERKPYEGSLPKSIGNTNVANTHKGNRAAPKGNGCFESGAPGHFKRDCPKLKNKDGGNGNAQGWVYTVGNAKKRGNALGNPDANVVTDIDQSLSYGQLMKMSRRDRISAKKKEDKSEGKQIKDVTIVQDFPEVFPEDLPGLPPARPVEFQIDLIPGAAPVARAPFIEGFSKIAKSMTKLTQKGIKFDWGEKEENAFQLIKQKLCSAPILALPEGSEDFVVYCDNVTQWFRCCIDAKREGKANVMADTLSCKERIEPLRVRALVITIGLDLPKRILEAQIEA